MNISKEATYTIQLTDPELKKLIKEMNTVYPLFAAEGDVDEIEMLLRLKDELAIVANND